MEDRRFLVQVRRAFRPSCIQLVRASGSDGRAGARSQNYPRARPFSLANARYRRWFYLAREAATLIRRLMSSRGSGSGVSQCRASHCPEQSVRPAGCFQSLFVMPQRPLSTPLSSFVKKQS
jgi:hypothetical protein